MQYVNPLELLNMSDCGLEEISQQTIRKQKRRLFAEIELSEIESAPYKDRLLDKSKCESVIDCLDDKEDIKYHHGILKFPALCGFITKEKISIEDITALQNEPINKRLIERFSREIEYQCEKQIFDSYLKQDDEKILHLGVIAKLYIKTPNFDPYNNIKNEIESNVKHIFDLRKELAETNEFKRNFGQDILKEVHGKFPIKLINSLPDNLNDHKEKIVDGLNKLAVVIWDKTPDYYTPRELMLHILGLKYISKERSVHENNLRIYDKGISEHENQVNFASELAPWKNVISKLIEIESGIDNKKASKDQVLNAINQINVNQLNELGSFATSTRDEISSRLRGISISLWNTSNDYDTAIKALIIASNINCSGDIKPQILNDLQKLYELKSEIETKYGKPVESAPPLFLLWGCGLTVYGSTYFFVILGIPIIPIAKYNCTHNGETVHFHGKLEMPQWQKVWKYLMLIVIGLKVLVSMFS